MTRPLRTRLGFLAFFCGMDSRPGGSVPSFWGFSRRWQGIGDAPGSGLPEIFRLHGLKEIRRIPR